MTFIKNNAFRSIVAGFFALGVGACFASAHAAPISLINGNSVTVGGLQITVSNCQLNNGSGASACTLSDGLQLVATNSSNPTGPSVTALIQGTSGHILQGTVGDGKTHDLSFDLTIQTVGGGAKINSAALAITGSAPTDLEKSRLTTGEVVTVAGKALPTMNVNVMGPSSASKSFAAQSSITVHKDINLRTTFTSPGTSFGDIMLLSTVSQVYGQVPEPATVGILATGIALIGAVRRRRSKAASAA